MSEQRRTGSRRAIRLADAAEDPGPRPSGCACSSYVAARARHQGSATQAGAAAARRPAPTTGRSRCREVGLADWLSTRASTRGCWTGEAAASSWTDPTNHRVHCENSRNALQLQQGRDGGRAGSDRVMRQTARLKDRSRCWATAWAARSLPKPWHWADVSDQVDRIVLLRARPVLRSADRQPLEVRGTDPRAAEHRAVACNPSCIDPRVKPTMGRSLDSRTGPQDLNKLYRSLARRFSAHDENATAAPISRTSLQPRLSFMYGMPYHHDNLVEGIHGTDGTDHSCRSSSAPFRWQMYLHAARNLRAGMR